MTGSVSTRRHPLPVCAPEFVLPLDQPEFTAALRQGLGRARLHADRHGLRGHEASVVACCLADPSYDPQCEGRESSWWLDMAYTAGVVPRVLVELNEPIAESHFTFWDRVWRIKVAAELARRGERRGVDIVLALCGPSDGGDVFGDEEAIELAGADGLLLLAERVGKRESRDREARPDSDFLRIYDARFGEGEALRVLGLSTLPGVRRFLAGVDRGSTSAGPNLRRVERVGFDPARGDRRPPMTGEEFLRRFDALPFPKPRFAAAVWSGFRPPQDLASVFQRLMGEADLSSIVCLCGCFTKQGFPTFDERTLGLLRHPDQEVRRRAWLACRSIAHQSIRGLIDEAIATAGLRPEMIDALQSNWRPADSGPVIHALRETADEHDRHNFGYAVTQIAPHVADDLVAVLLWVYATTPCVNCRLWAIEDVARRASIPAWMLTELRCDSCPDVRAYARGDSPDVSGKLA